MVKRMRLPLLIAVIAIVALLLPGPAALADPSWPRLTGTTSYFLGLLTGSCLAASASTFTFWQ